MKFGTREYKSRDIVVRCSELSTALLLALHLSPYDRIS